MNVPIKVLIISFLLLATIAVEAFTPIWDANYPSVISGASSIDIKLSLNVSGKAYYVIYDSKQEIISSQNIKDDALSIKNFIAKGSVNIRSAHNEEIVLINKLKDNTTYYLYLVGESLDGTLTEKSTLFTCVMAERHSQNGYYSTIIKGLVGYNAYFPEEYYKNSEKNLPVLIFLHGQGEKAKSTTELLNLKDVRVYGPPYWIDQGYEFPFIVISPQTPWGWNVEAKDGTLVAEILEVLLYKYNIDPSRVYVTGLSMGGNGTYGFLESFPQKIAAALPFAGYCNVENVCASKEVPYWAFHNLYDPVIGVGNDRSMQEIFNACKPPVPAQLTLFSNYSHDCWSAPYSKLSPGTDNIYDWALLHVKGNYPEDGTNKTPHIYAGPNLQVLSETKEVTFNSKGYDEDGSIQKYRWAQVDGPSTVMKNENTPTLSVSNLKDAKYKFRLTAEDNKGRTTFDEVWLEVSSFILSATNSYLTNHIISITPNPVKEIIHIESPEFLENPSVTIINMQGKVIAEISELNSDGSSYSLNLSPYNISPGIYLIKFYTPKVTFTAKFLKD